MLKIWNTINGSEITTLRGHTHNVRGCDKITRDDGSTDIVSTSFDHTIKIWSTISGNNMYKCKMTLHGHTRAVYGCCIYKNSMILSASHDNTLRLWDSITGRNIVIIDCSQFLQQVPMCSVLLDNTIVAGGLRKDTRHHRSSNLAFMVWKIDDKCIKSCSHDSGTWVFNENGSIKIPESLTSKLFYEDTDGWLQRCFM